MDKIIVKGKTSKGEIYRQELIANTKEIDLVSKELTSINLGPLAQCPNLEWIMLEFNPMKNVDLSTLAGNSNLEWIRIDKKTTILWKNKILNIDTLPIGLQEHKEEISQANQLFLKENMQERK